MGKYRRWGVIAAVVFFVLCITGVLFPMMYYLNDDVTMRSILSGTYTGTPDGHAVYMKYPLTGIISLLYRIVTGVPWFSLLMSGFFFLAVTMLLGQLASVSKKLSAADVSLIICMALLCAALFLPHFVYLHYTVVAAILGSCGLFLTALDGGKKAAVLFILCYCVRSQVFFLLLPFFAIILIWKLWEKKWRDQVIILAFLAGGILICMAWNALMYRSEEWKQFAAYNESRTQLYDYHDLLSYEEYRDQYESAGIDEWEYSILEQYTLALDGEVDAKMLQAASDIYSAKREAERSAIEYIKFCLTEYYYHSVYTDKPYNYILICAYLLTIILLLWKKQWMQFLLVCCMAAGRSMIWVFLIWQGRFPERIYISLYLIEIMVLAGMICAVVLEHANDKNVKPWSETFPKEEKRKRDQSVIVCACILFSLVLLGVSVAQMAVSSASVYLQQENQKKWNALTTYCKNNYKNFYLLDVRSMVSYAGEVWENDSGYANYLLVGGWMSATPLLQDRIDGMGASDGGELLIRRTDDERILYIASHERDVNWLSGYLVQRFGSGQIEHVDSIMLDGEEIFCVYSVVYP